MERRLESILYKSFFTSTIKQARNLILHGHIAVNKQIIRQGSYLINNNDIIEIINPQIRKFVKDNIKKSRCWPFKQNTLAINYKTLKIRYLMPSMPLDLLATVNNPFSFPVNLRRVLHYYRYN